MRLLYALGSVSTLLGLIGTISGMIKAFQVAAVAGVGRVDQLSTGIYEAMTAPLPASPSRSSSPSSTTTSSAASSGCVSEINDTVNRFADEAGANDPESHKRTERPTSRPREDPEKERRRCESETR